MRRTGVGSLVFHHQPTNHLYQHYHHHLYYHYQHYQYLYHYHYQYQQQQHPGVLQAGREEEDRRTPAPVVGQAAV